MQNFDHARASFDALAACPAIRAEAREITNDTGYRMTREQAVNVIIAARWPNLPEREAYAAAARHYDVELPA